MFRTVLFLLATTTLVFSSCEGGTELTKTFKNQSEEEIRLVLFNPVWGRPQGDTLTLLPMSDMQYYAGGGERRFFDYPDCLDEIDRIQVTLPSGKKLKKDIMDPANWTMESTGKNYQVHHCVFVITGADIE
ncbi:MAG: hypothetical protein EP344_14270 [Bacteroidetes bacterium]|nr:MAG: hypothetical protein EP344_14270 [Bacteroidota bacterium]